MKGYRTSFTGLFRSNGDDAPDVTSVEIPLIQRDYAQGRPGSRVSEIRDQFLDVLHDAAIGNVPVDLDFVWGDFTDGTLRPLDGQQRLTTLFLLHWYLALRCDRLREENDWTQFSYATRPSARLFCRRLVESPPPAESAVFTDWVPSAWIADQPWYLYVWHTDPTIQSMLVVIDAIHRRFRDEDVTAAWRRLVDTDAPSISFQLLPIEEIGSGDELYIKMNSRGKPLTEFENFKARFEQSIAGSRRAAEFGHKVDGAWSDLLWPIHGGDNIVDDEFMRYFAFLTEICEWREGILDGGRLEPRAARVFADSRQAASNLDFMFGSFDVWRSREHIAATFDEFFTTPEAVSVPGGGSKVVLFGTMAKVDLFEACCHNFGELRGNIRVFSQAQSLLLYAVLLHLIYETPEFPRRLRVLRNLIAASENEIRRDNMPKLVGEVDRIIADGSLHLVATFNQAQVAEEQLKLSVLAQHPDLTAPLFRLEDHVLLRGSLGAIDLDPRTLAPHAEAFDRAFSDPELWPALTGALLAAGSYARQPWADSYYFGTGSREHERVWRWLLTNGGRPQLGTVRDVLAQFLSGLAGTDLPVAEYLAAVTATWLRHRQESAELDWRYYLVRYGCMREGDSGIYKGVDGKLGYSMVMLRKTRLYSWYRDPFLLAIWRESGVRAAVNDPWFTGSETIPRWMELSRSSTRMRSVERGIALRPPPADDHSTTFDQILQHHVEIIETDDGSLLAVPQQPRGGVLIDTEDRVQLGATLLRELVEAGL